MHESFIGSQHRVTDSTLTHTKAQHKWSLTSHKSSIGSKRPSTPPLPLDWHKKKKRNE